MEAAFAADKVDLSIRGDWEEIQIELGLLDERITPVPPSGWILDEMERENPGMAESFQKVEEALEHLRARRTQAVAEASERRAAAIANQRTNAHRTKRDHARKLAKQAKKKQRAKKKSKKR